MSKQPIKIQLNLEALERLIGGDTEAEVELRQSVVENFSHRHLKALANETLMQRQEHAVRRYVDEQIAKETWQGAKLSPNVIEAIRTATGRIVMDIINSEAVRRYEEMKASVDTQIEALRREALERIAFEVERAMPENIEAVISKEVERRLLAIAKLAGKGEGV